jgi:heat shock protein HslJ
MIGCSTTSKLNTASKLVKNKWVLSSLTGSPDLGKLFGSNLPSLSFTKDGKISGSDGCNSLAGSIPPDLMSSGKLDLSKLSSTRKACNNEEGAKSLLGALTKTKNFKIDDNILNLLDGDGNNLASFISQ